MTRDGGWRAPEEIHFRDEQEVGESLEALLNKTKQERRE